MESKPKEDAEAITQQNALRIKVPVQNERVPERPFVERTLSDPKATVWVIVHPMEISNYWVQPTVSVMENSTWKVKIYVGRPEQGIGDIHDK